MRPVDFISLKQIKNWPGDYEFCTGIVVPVGACQGKVGLPESLPRKCCMDPAWLQPPDFSRRIELGKAGPQEFRSVGIVHIPRLTCMNEGV